jgi:hypothetical protein
MTDQNQAPNIHENGQNRTRLGIGSQLILFTLIIGVVILAILTFTRPISQVERTITPCPTAIALTATAQPSGTAIVTTPTSEVVPLTPEEIGYTDLIIFWSTVLVLILLVAVLRETILQKKSSS